MIKDSMWFENKEHYRFYLRRIAKFKKALEEAQKASFEQLIKKVKELSLK